MIPKSISASSLLVSQACMERWRVETFLRTPQTSSAPANTGSAVHYALEHFVNDVYLEKKYGWQEIKHLKAYYDLGYIETFGSTDFNTPEYVDGAELVAKWYDVNKDGLPHEVLSVEKKETFPVRSSAGFVPYTYIYDRLDRIDDETVHVVDYKTIRAPISPADLKKKIQPRSYALAAQIKFPEAQRIWVSFDMIRHGGIVGTVFDRDENAATYRYIQRALERIIATPEDQTKETINDECKWCIKKSTCNTLASAQAGGSILGLPIEELAKRKHLIDAQALALKYAQEELDKAICTEAERRDEFEFEVEGGYEVKIGARPRRTPNSNAISRIVGPDMAAKYGNFTVTNVDKMLKSGELDAATAAKVKAEITTAWSEPSSKVKKKEEF